MTFLGIILGLLILSLLVTVHEFGHYIAAKKAGVVVEEFAIGMGPLAWSKKLKNGTLFSIRWLPIGGFCKMKGENDADRKKGSYGSATFWQKTKILFGGITFNWIFAIVTFTILAITGLPQAFSNQFHIPSDTKVIYSPVTLSNVVEDSPAHRAGLQVGDELVRIADAQITLSSDVPELTKRYAGETVQIIVVRDNSEISTAAAIREHNDDGQGFLGISSYQNSFTRSTWSAPIVGVGVTVQFTAETFKGVGKMAVDFFGGLAKQISPNADTRQSGQDSISAAGEGVAGPIGIIGIIFPSAAQSGPTTLMFLAGVISLSLAVMNFLPIPALDGGRWLLTAVFRAIKKPLTQEIEEKVTTIGFLSLMALIVLVTIVDITRFF